MSAIAEIPQIDTYGMKCDTIPGNLSLTNFSQMVYQWRGKGDYTSQSPLALLCRRNLTDCEAGISIHGHSLGGLLANLAPQLVDMLQDSDSDVRRKALQVIAKLVQQDRVKPRAPTRIS